MSYLLDTHALYWWLYFPDFLPPAVRRVLGDTESRIFISAVSTYEMSYKYHRGRWPEIADLIGAFEDVVAAEKFELLSLSAKHANLAGKYSARYKDPFDRMLAAQAVTEALTFISRDKEVAALGVEVLWS